MHGPDGYEERTAAADESARDRDMDELLADDDYDPTPWCSYGHRTEASCDCGDIAENN